MRQEKKERWFFSESFHFVKHISPDPEEHIGSICNEEWSIIYCDHTSTPALAQSEITFKHKLEPGSITAYKQLSAEQIPSEITRKKKEKKKENTKHWPIQVSNLRPSRYALTN